VWLLKFDDRYRVVTTEKERTVVESRCRSPWLKGGGEATKFPGGRVTGGKRVVGRLRQSWGIGEERWSAGALMSAKLKEAAP